MAARTMHEVDGNRLTAFPDGPERLEALLALIGGATRELRLLYYIFAPDAAGTRVRDAAIAAQGRGVRVSLLIDGFGSEGADDAFLAPLVAAGAHVCRFVPRFGRRYLVRNHQKMAIADTATVMIGGFNIEDDYFTPPGQGWRDLGLLVEGPAVAALLRYFDALERWAARPKATIRSLNRLIRATGQGEGRLRWLFGGPTRRLSPWARTLREDVDRGHRLDMIAAYFAPSLGVLRRFGRLARGGGVVRIVTAAKSDNGTTIAAARHTYRKLLRRGARVFEYQPEKLHTKLFVVDDASYVGSANCDMRSLFLNLEVMLRVEDRGFAEAMRAYIDGEVAECREASLAQLEARAGWWLRLKWSLAYFVVAVVDYSVTRRLNLGPGGDVISE